MEFVYNDGGRSKYFKGSAGDCVTRAIAIATGKDYKEIYDTLNRMSERESVKRHRGHKRSQSRNGVFKETWKRYLRDLGWVKISTCSFGSSQDKVKFIDGALPDKGTYIVQLSKHLTVLKDGVINDTYDCSTKDYYDWESGELMTNDERCVYGYWRAPSQEEIDSKAEQEAEMRKMKEKQQQALNETKVKIEEIKKAHASTINKLEKKIKELKHQLVVETNRMNREIKKVKEADADKFINDVLDEDYCIIKEQPKMKKRRFTL